MIRAHQAAKEHGVRLVVGCRLDLTDGATVLVYPTDRAAYAAALPAAHPGQGPRRQGRLRTWLGRPCRTRRGPAGHAGAGQGRRSACRLAGAAAGGFSRPLLYGADAAPPAGMRSGSCKLADLAAQAGVLDVVTNDVLFHSPERRILQDVVTCIREGCAIDDAGSRRNRFADRHLKAPHEMERLFGRHRAAVARSMEIVRRCTFSVAELAGEYQYPHEVVIPGLTAQQALEKLTWEAVAERFPNGAKPEMIELLHKELRLIGEMGYAPYFLTVHAIVQHPRRKERDPLPGPRLSSQFGLVCYVLKITVKPSPDFSFPAFREGMKAITFQ